jgi:uncharacterized protein
MLLELEDIYKVVPKDVIKDIFDEFELDLLDGYHGFYHWSRVIENGMFLSEDNGTNLNVIIAFGFFHDCKRENDDEDPEHGFRGSQIMAEYKDRLGLTNEEFQKAYTACDGHTNEKHHEDLDIATCWDADRLDLMRVGIYPKPEFLNNDLAKEDWVIESRSEIAEYEENPSWADDLVEDIINSPTLTESLEQFEAKYAESKETAYKKPKNN